MSGASMGPDGASGGAQMTERQKKWFATVQANFVKQTGKSMDDWAAIARAGCDGLPVKAQVAWLKEHHGLGVNHAAQVLGAAFPSGPGWDDPAALRAALWKDPTSLAILEAIEARAAGLDGLVTAQRKGYTSFSKAVQFAAARPQKGGRALLGLKLDPAASPRLKPNVRKESWSERLTAIVELDTPAEADAEIGRLLAEAWKNG